MVAAPDLWPKGRNRQAHSAHEQPRQPYNPAGLLGMGPARLPVGDASLGALHGASMAPALPLASSKRGAKQLKGRCPCELTCTQCPPPPGDAKPGLPGLPLASGLMTSGGAPAPHHAAARSGRRMRVV